MIDGPLVCVVILNWNGLPYVISCLETVLASHYARLSVIVVDNGSTDDSANVIAARFPGVTLCRSQTNLGYAAGNNLGIQAALDAGADYVWLLNNDTEVQANTLGRLVDTLENKRHAAIAAPKIYLLDEPERLWAVGGALKSRQVQTWGINELDRGQYDDVELDFVFGCSMLVRREVFEQIGLLDADFVFYYEDIDFCIRARQAGFSIALVPQAAMRHKSPLGTQSASSFKIYHYERNRILFFCKHLQGREKLWFVLAQAPHLLTAAWRHTRQSHSPTAWWHTTRAIVGALTTCWRKKLT